MTQTWHKGHKKRVLNRDEGVIAEEEAQGKLDLGSLSSMSQRRDGAGRHESLATTKLSRHQAPPPGGYLRLLFNLLLAFSPYGPGLTTWNEPGRPAARLADLTSTTGSSIFALC
jgi:hypothetical protein